MDPANTASPQGFGALLSHVIGWTYFIAWSASFYPQAILNWRRKSVRGLSMDFIYLNVLGFLCYSIFNLSFYYSPEIQKEYRRRNAGQDNLVRANDVLFAVHALILSTFTLSQTLIYKRDHDQRVSNPTKLFMLITVSGAGIILASRTIFSSSPSSQWIDLLYYLSYIKLGISFLKYCPQVYLNYTSRSTVGWSIHNILLDFTGGVLSIAQLILDAAISDDWSGISGDPVKLGLGLLSTLFDLVFMTQHYVLYRNREDRYAPVAMVEENQGEHKGLMVLFQGRKGYGSVVGDDREAEIVDDNGARRPGGSMKDLEIGR